MRRVYDVALNYRSIAPVQREITLQIQKAMIVNDLAEIFDSFVDVIELVLINRFHYLSESNIDDRLKKSCTLNYEFGDDEIKYSIEKSRVRDVASNFLTYLIRRLIDLNTEKVISLCQTSSLRVELKLQHFTRAHFITNFDQSVEDSSSEKKRCVSVSLICFIDDFDLYRNRQRSLMRMYMIIAVFTFRERARRVNVLSLTLNSHDSNFANVIVTLQHIEDLDENLTININDEKIFLCVFTHMFVDDMSQQQKNFEFKSQNANLDCRFCYIVNTKRDQLDYDLFNNDRFHNQTIVMRKKMQTSRTKRDRETYATK